LIQQYIHLANFEIVPIVAALIYPLMHYRPYDANVYKKGKESLEKVLSLLNNLLLTRTYFVGDRITAADIKLSITLHPLFTMIVDADNRKPFANLMRWFITCVNQPEFIAVQGTVTLCVSEQQYKPKEEKPLEAAMAAASLDDDEEALAEPKAKNPLDLLPPTSFNLESWKRFYSNNETRPTACDYFWNNYDKSGFSMFRLSYKDNKDLTLVFMSSNLIGGFYQRLDHMRKYAFGSMCVFGENNNNMISGMFIFRGPGLPEMLKEVPDYDSYDFEQVNPDDAVVRAEWESYLAWDGTLNGLAFADGKIFK
jgi:elongation factor 1-gamma